MSWQKKLPNITKKYNVAINIKDKGITILEYRFKFKIKLLSNTRVDQLKEYANDVKMALKLPLFQILQEDLAIFILASKETNQDNSLIRILASQKYKAAKKVCRFLIPLASMSLANLS